MTEPADAVADLADKTLLLLDDDAPLRTRLGRALESRGFQVTLAGSVSEAIGAVKSAAPAFAVVDMRLEDGSGLCRIWDGQVYALTGGGAEQLNSREATPAPNGLLLPDFGAAFTEGADFAKANPEGWAWDAFTLTGCSDE